MSCISILRKLTSVTVVAIEVLIKFCITSLPRIDQFIHRRIDQLPVCVFVNQPMAFSIS